MRTELQRLQRQTGITMVFVTHDQSEALALADRIVLMNDGRIAQTGSPEALYNEPQSVFAADFVGFENIFSIDNASPNTGSVAHRQSGAFKLGFHADATHAAWRPGGVVVGQGEQGGVVAGVAFAGDRREYVIDTDAGVIKADVDAAEPAVQPGEAVKFDLPESSARLIRDPAGANPR